jgi:hypothetical protein
MASELRGGKRNQRRRANDLPDTMQMAVSMKVMVTSNIETNLDVVNGAQCEIIVIILHPDEPPLGDDPIVALQYLPSYILVKLKQTHTGQLEGLNEDVIFVEVTTGNFQIKVKTNGGKYITLLCT